LGKGFDRQPSVEGDLMKATLRLCAGTVSVFALAVLAVPAGAQSDKAAVTSPVPSAAQKKADMADTAKAGQQARGAAAASKQDATPKMGPRTGAQMAPHDQSGNAGQGPGQTGYRKGPTQMAPHDQSGNAGQGPGQTGYRKGPTQMVPHDQSGNAGQGPGQTGYRKGPTQMAPSGAEGQGPGQSPPGGQRQAGGSTVGQPNPNAHKGMMKSTQMKDGGAAGQGPGQSPPGGQRAGIAGQPNPAAAAVKGAQ
jgi:hypothetical protein